jgi:hypothetical protein
MIQTREYLVNYGQGGFLGRFRSANVHVREDRIIIRSPRGEEMGTVLGESATSVTGPAVEGNVLRAATSQDLECLDRLRKLASGVVTEAQSLAEEMHLPLLVLDGEMLLEPREAILHTVHWDECDATPMFEELSRRRGFLVKVADLTARPALAAKTCATCGDEKSGCDSCGSGGGCSSGSCSSGSVKSAEELTTYFAGLRKQMEAADARVSLH